jgi:hypothetical protein
MQLGDDGWKIITEGENYKYVPSSVIGLTYGGPSCQRFLLDVDLGVVYWPGCPDDIRYNAIRESVSDDPYDWAPEGEAEWRGDAEAWEVGDFFEILKDQYRTTKFLPITSREVLDVYGRTPPGQEGWIPMVQRIYREHGWPDIERYRKEECVAAVQKAMFDNYSNLVDEDRVCRD